MEPTAPWFAQETPLQERKVPRMEKEARQGAFCSELQRELQQARVIATTNSLLDLLKFA